MTPEEAKRIVVETAELLPSDYGELVTMGAAARLVLEAYDKGVEDERNAWLDAITKRTEKL